MVQAGYARQDARMPILGFPVLRQIILVFFGGQDAARMIWDDFRTILDDFRMILGEFRMILG